MPDRIREKVMIYIIRIGTDLTYYLLPSSATYITSDGMLFGSDRLVTINTKNWHDVAFAVI